MMNTNFVGISFSDVIIVDRSVMYFNIVDLGEIGWSGVDWVGQAQGRDRWRALVNAVMNLRVL
jgi:hypothetical protein